MWINRKRLERLERLEERITELESEVWLLKSEREIWWDDGLKTWFKKVPFVCYEFERRKVGIQSILVMLLNHFGLSYEDDAAKLVKKTKKA